MSKYWGLHCKTCDETSEHDFNHGEQILRSMVKAWPHIKAAQEADESGYLEFSIMAHQSSDLFQFLFCHFEHDLELSDEYGGVEPLEESSIL